MATQKNGLIYYGPRDPLAPLSVERERRIQEVAYFKAMKRHFASGYELEDWLAAEEEVDDALRRVSEDRGPTPVGSGARSKPT